MSRFVAESNEKLDKIYGIIRQISETLNVVLLAPFLILVGIAVIQGIEKYMPEAIYKCSEMKPIKSIGGCDAFGNCGVRYGDETTGIEHLPVHGHYACIKHEWFGGVSK